MGLLNGNHLHVAGHAFAQLIVAFRTETTKQVRAFASTLGGRVASHLLNLKSVVLVGCLNTGQTTLPLMQRVRLSVTLEHLSVLGGQLYFGALFRRLGSNLRRQILKRLLGRLLLQILLLK